MNCIASVITCIYIYCNMNRTVYNYSTYPIHIPKIPFSHPEINASKSSKLNLFNKSNNYYIN